MSRTILVLFIAIQFFQMRIHAQQADYEMFAHYSNENGLPQNSINWILQDKKGFIWIATSSGLVRFDGHRFRTFNMINYSSRASNRVHQIFEYDDRIFALESGVFTMESMQNVLFEIMDENTIRAVKIDSLIVLRRTGVAYRISKPLYEYKKKYNFISLVDIITNKNGSEGYCADSVTSYIFYYRAPEAPVKLPVKSWRNMDHSFSLNGRLYAIDQFNRLACFEKMNQRPSGGSLLKLIESAGPAVIKESRFFQIKSVVYFATDNGVYLVRETSPGIVDAELLTSFASQPDKRSFLFLPDQQVLFIGTGNDGIFLYQKRHFSVLQVPEKLPDIFDRSRYLLRPTNIFYPVAELNDSTILTNWGGLTMSKRIVPTENVFFPERNIASPAPGYFLGFKPGSDEPVITDHQLKEVGLMDPVNRPKQFHLSCREKDFFYIRTLSNGKWSIKKYQVKHPLKLILVDEYPDWNYDTHCMIKSGDTLWIGTSNGLCVVDLKRKTSNIFKGLEQTVVRALYCDVSGKVWIGTYGKGWYLLDKGKLKKLYTDRNGYLENVHAFLEDDKGFLWLSTNNGLFRFLKTDLEKTNGPDDPVFYNYYSREYGFMTNEFNGGCSPAALRMSNGKFVFPGMNGLVVFDPGEVPREETSGKILLSEFTVNGKPVKTLEGQELNPGFNNISLNVFVPYFGQVYNLQLEYRLSSGMESWTRLPDNGVISFNRLSHGNYTLQVRMLKGFGSGEYLTREITFTVAPRWYQTTLFYLSGIILMALLSVLYVRWRTHSIKRQKLVLEKEVESRTEALKASEEKVRQNAQFKSQVTSLVLHDVRSPLYYLNKITGNIYQSTEGKVPDHIREELKDLHLSVKDISAYAQTLFAWISAQQDNFVLRPAKIRLAEMLEGVCVNYQLLAVQNNNKISYHADPKLSVVTQSDLLQIVIRNLVDNAIKFTRNGGVLLSAAAEDGHVSITVKDTGRGMTADRVERILGNDKDEISDTRSGMGYRLIRDLLKKMGGTLSVISAQGMGTAVTIRLPADPVDS